MLQTVIDTEMAAVEAQDDFLVKYVARVGLPPDLQPTSAVLKAVMSAHTRAIAFENLDVALGRTISMDAEDVTRKLLDLKRGGYCFEQNTLLKLALEAIGFQVTPLLCRVRWGKRPDEETAFTHMCLKVGGREFDPAWPQPRSLLTKHHGPNTMPLG